MSDRGNLKAQQIGALQTFSTTGGLSLGATTAATVDPYTTVGDAQSIFLTWTKAADDAMASTATAETFTGLFVPFACKYRKLTYSPTSGALTNDNTNNAVMTFNTRDLNGANLAVLTTLTTSITALGATIAQGQGVAALPAGTVAASVAAGSTITYSIAKGGSGVVVRAGLFTLQLEPV